MKTKAEIRKRIEELRKEEVLSYPTATIDQNAPLALMQLSTITKLHTLEWIMGDILTNVKDLQRELEDRYFAIRASSAEYGGYNYSFYVKAKNEKELENSGYYERVEEYVRNCIEANLVEEDYKRLEDPGTVNMDIEEVTKEEYDLYVGENKV